MEKDIKLMDLEVFILVSVINMHQLILMMEVH